MKESLKEIDSYIDQLSSLGIKEDISRERIELYKKLYDEGKYFGLLAKLMQDFNLKTKVRLIIRGKGEIAKSNIQFACLDQSHLTNPFIPAITAFVRNTPMFGTWEFKSHIHHMELDEEMTSVRFEMLVCCLCHELAHILLYSLRHPLKNSEIATDLTVMILGYSEIVKLGRYDYSKGLRCGYLTDEQFEFAYRKLKPNFGRSLLNRFKLFCE